MKGHKARLVFYEEICEKNTKNQLPEACQQSNEQEDDER
jgi:hypothetical protein